MSAFRHSLLLTTALFASAIASAASAETSFEREHGAHTATPAASATTVSPAVTVGKNGVAIPVNAQGQRVVQPYAGIQATTGAGISPTAPVTATGTAVSGSGSSFSREHSGAPAVETTAH